MDLTEATAKFGALAQTTRLEVLQHLVSRGEEGESAGTLATHTGVPASTLSFHLKELQRSGLVTAERRGRQIQYRVDAEALRQLASFLSNDCRMQAEGELGPEECSQAAE